VTIYSFSLAVFAIAILAALLVLRSTTRADRRLRNAIAALPEGIAFFDKLDRLYLWNEAYEAVAGSCLTRLRRGVTLRELLEEDLKSAHYADAIGQEQAWLQERLMEYARAEGFREQYLHDGRWLRVADRRDADGGTVSICMDVTEVKRREESFKLMFDNNPVPMWLWHGSKRLPVIDLNQAALDHLGYSKEDIPNLTVFDLLSEEEWPTLNEMQIDRPCYGERVWRPRCKDGTLRNALPYIHILPDPLGNPRFLGAIVDVTERVAAEEERRQNETLAKALDQARESDRIKSEFLAVMSHELRTPLNAILGFSDIIRSQTFGPVGSERYREYACDIHNSGTHLLSLINDILDLSRLDAGKMDLQLEFVDVAALVADCVHSVDVQASKSGIRIDMESGHRSWRLRIDARRVRQMLLNLLSNAVKFTEAGGNIRITLGPRQDGFAIAIADTGIGIAPENLVRAMERFGQIDSSTSRRYEGTGLGLPLTKHLAELHGATFDIQSRVGVGTTATILFPLTSVADSESTAMPPEFARDARECVDSAKHR
jgi:PAS domain S-box-containing protein